MKNELWTEVHDIVQETGSKTIPMEKKCKKAKWLSGEALQIAVKRREAKSKTAFLNPYLPNRKQMSDPCLTLMYIFQLV